MPLSVSLNNSISKFTTEHQTDLRLIGGMTLSVGAVCLIAAAIIFTSLVAHQIAIGALSSVKAGFPFLGIGIILKGIGGVLILLSFKRKQSESLDKESYADPKEIESIEKKSSTLSSKKSCSSSSSNENEFVLDDPSPSKKPIAPIDIPTILIPIPKSTPYPTISTPMPSPRTSMPVPNSRVMQASNLVDTSEADQVALPAKELNKRLDALAEELKGQRYINYYTSAYSILVKLSIIKVAVQDALALDSEFEKKHYIAIGRSEMEARTVRWAKEFVDIYNNYKLLLENRDK